MTELLEKAFEEASKLSKDEQDALAQWLLQEFQAERRWEELLSNSAEELASLADEALREDEEEQTLPLDSSL